MRSWKLSNIPRHIDSVQLRPAVEPLNPQHRKLREATVSFEAMFVKELLKNSTSGISRGMFGGGMAEEFFQDFLNDERAKTMVAGGGFGIAKLLEEEILSLEKNKLKEAPAKTDDIIMNINQLKAKEAYQ